MISKMETVSLVGVIAFVWRVKTWWDTLVPIIRPLVIDAENRAKDGVIDKEDRKQLVLTLLRSCEAQGAVKLNPLTRWLAGIVIDRIAKKLPDFSLNEKVSGKPKA